MMLCANFAKKVPLEELLPAAKSIGFQHLQFSFVHFGINDDNPIIDSSFLDKAEQIKNLSVKWGIDYPVIHGWLPSSPAAEEVLAIYLEVKKLLHSRYIVIHSKDLENLHFIITFLANHPAKESLLIENVAEPAFKMGLKEINGVTKQKFNLCFDTCHALESSIDIHQFLENQQKNIKVMHLSDFDGEKRHISIGSAHVNKEFVNKIPPEMIVIFEHKARSVTEYREVYEKSFTIFSEYMKN